MKHRTLYRWLVPAIILSIGGAIVLPPLVSLNRFHHRIADSIGRGIGRPVTMSSVKMQLLPRPGFEIADFVVEEDPAFGAEPILRCAQVTAYVRIFPLWRSHLEIARIGFDEPSLNLVRNAKGRWNFDSLLSQATQISNAPTAQRHSGDLPRFPYIDASNARINFKIGDEKKPFSFLNADLAVWLANPGEWRLQFAAQPVRTDLSLDLANTGLVRVEGSLRRAPAFSQMPVDLHAEWSNAPLGQLSRILIGSDADWRGELNATAEITGSLEHASLKLVAKGRGIHRVEFEPREPLNLDTTCEVQFTRAGRSLDAITCLTPTGAGHLLLTGSVHDMAGKIDPALSLEINHTPVASAFDGVRLIRSGFAPAVEATGTIDGNFSYGRSAPSAEPRISGQAAVTSLTIAAPAFEKPLALPPLHFTMSGSEPERASNARSISRSALRPKLKEPRSPISALQEAILRLEPFLIAQPDGLPSSLSLGGLFAKSGFTIHASGQSRPADLSALGKEFGLLRNRSLTFGPQGTADLDLTVHGPWLRPLDDADHPSAPLALDGTLRLRSTQVAGSFLAQPLQIASAQATFADNRIEWSAPSLIYGPVHADGSLIYPAFCDSSAECAHRFTLHIASLDAATAQMALLGAGQHGELIRQFLARINPNDRSEHAWPAMRGTLQIGTLTVEDLTVRDLAATMIVEGSRVELKSVTGHTLEGELQLSGSMEVRSGLPHYAIEAHLDHATIPALAAIFHEKWGPGSLDLTTKLEFSGFETKELTSSATGTFHWDWTKGGLSVDQPSPMGHFDNWMAQGSIAKGSLTLEKSLLENGADDLPLTGTIDLDRKLDLASPDAPNPLKITGTLEHPEAASSALNPKS